MKKEIIKIQSNKDKIVPKKVLEKILISLP